MLFNLILVSKYITICFSFSHLFSALFFVFALYTNSPLGSWITFYHNPKHGWKSEEFTLITDFVFKQQRWNLLGNVFGWMAFFRTHAVRLWKEAEFLKNLVKNNSRVLEYCSKVCALGVKLLIPSKERTFEHILWKIVFELALFKLRQTTANIMKYLKG